MKPELKKKVISIMFRNNVAISKWHSLRDLKKELKREDLNRVCLFMHTRDRYQNEDSDDDEYIDESSLLAYLTNQHESGSMKFFKITLKIPLSSNEVEVIPLLIEPEFFGRDIIREIIKILRTDYNHLISEDDIREIAIPGYILNTKLKR